MSNYRYGIDISHYQGNVDFHKVKESGKEFIIMKVSQRMKVDDHFETYYAAATAEGIPVGAYIYNKVKTLDEAKDEARFAVAQLRGKHLACGVWLDMEDASMKSLGKSMLTNVINTEAQILIDAGFKVGIYCNKSWYKSVLDTNALVPKYPFWIAGYPSKDTGIVVESLRPTYGHIWQYSSKGSVPGIVGNVDMNEANCDVAKLMDVRPVYEAIKPATAYTQAQFIADVKSILKTTTVLDAFQKTQTISTKLNKNSALVTPLERYMKALGYYTGSIEADKGKTPVFGSGMDAAITKYQTEVVKNKPQYCDGIVTAKGATWKKSLGIK